MTVTSSDLPAILLAHGKWLRGEAGGSRANLSGADLSGAKNSELAVALTRILPEGELIGWKNLQDGLLAKLRIPSDARRSHAFGRKCRDEFAEVLEIVGPKGGEHKTGKSQYDGSFIYAVGETVRPNVWNENWQEECAGGIHFFITRLEAENYVY